MLENGARRGLQKGLIRVTVVLAVETLPPKACSRKRVRRRETSVGRSTVRQGVELAAGALGRNNSITINVERRNHAKLTLG